MTNTNLSDQTMETISNQPANLMAATQALAENLVASEPFALYQQAHARFDADPQARDLIQHLSTCHKRKLSCAASRRTAASNRPT